MFALTNRTDSYPLKVVFLFFSWQFTFPSTGFLAGAPSCSFHFHSAVGLLLSQEPVRANATLLLLYLLLSAPPCVYFCSRCVWLCAPLARFVFHTLGAGAVLTRSCVFTAAAAAAAESLGVPSCVLLDKAIRASLHGLLLGAEDPAKCLDCGAERAFTH